MAINKVILIGNVGKDPEIKYFDNGGAVANFSLATTEKGYTSKNGIKVPDHTEWHNIVCYGAIAKIVEQYVKKGSKIYVEGKIKTRSYESNKVTHYITEIYIEKIELCGNKSGESNNDYNSANNKIPFSPHDNYEDGDDLPF